MAKPFYLILLFVLYVLASIFSAHHIHNGFVLVANLTGMVFVGKCIWDAISDDFDDLDKAAIQEVEELYAEIKANIANDEAKYMAAYKAWVHELAQELAQKLAQKLENKL